MPEQEQLSLRDTIESAVNEIEAPASDAPASAAPPAATAVADTRIRDEAGRFAKAEAAKAQAAATAAPAPAAAEPISWDQRGLAWKKEHWARFEKLEPELQNYILQRENEFKAGVSTYKSEAEAARSLKAAIDPFMPELQRNGIDPAQWIRNLGNAHQTLVLGSPQTKLAIFQRLAQDYGVPLQYLVPNQQGQVQQMDPTVQYLANNLQGLQQQWQQFQTQQQALEQQSIQQSIAEFRADTTQHPHFEAVREQMAALLSSGMARDMKEAYEKAVWMSPESRQALLTAQQQDEKAKQLEQQRVVVSKAKANAVSPKSSAPGAQTNATAKKGLREQLAEGFEQVTSARV